MSHIHLIGGEKGGVGKSLVSRLLAQYFIDRQIPFSAFDTDRSHGALLRFNAGYAVPVSLDKHDGLDVIVEAAALDPNRRVLVVVNVGEDDVERIPEVEARVRAEMTSAGDNVEVIGMCVQLEAEAATITDPVERAEMLEGFGLGEGALFRMVRSAYHLLGLRTYFTTGEKETRAWTFYAGSSAPECAGRIHSDFQRGFIKAEVIHWDELLEIGGWNKAKDVGKIRIEGKEYHPLDGDVMEFRFNV